MGVGMATAILVDAKIVRMVLVLPSCSCWDEPPGGSPAGSTASSPAWMSSRPLRRGPHWNVPTPDAGAGAQDCAEQIAFPAKTPDREPPGGDA
jgi:hypothetical protein